MVLTSRHMMFYVVVSRQRVVIVVYSWLISLTVEDYLTQFSYIYSSPCSRIDFISTLDVVAHRERCEVVVYCRDSMVSTRATREEALLVASLNRLLDT